MVNQNSASNCGVVVRVEGPIEWLEYMINNGGRPKKTTFEKLIESHFTDDRFDDALFVLGSMLKMGFVLSESICHSLVDKLCPDSSPELILY